MCAWYVTNEDISLFLTSWNYNTVMAFHCRHPVFLTMEFKTQSYRNTYRFKLKKPTELWAYGSVT
jgi:hypothetical protein